MANQEAKEKFYSEAEEMVYELLDDVIAKYHDDFTESEFLIQMRHGGWKSKGRTIFANLKVLTDALRTALKKDAILTINADMWKKMSDPQKVYVLDEALYGLDLKEDRHGDTKEAADGRPLLTTVSPDIQGFVEVMKRHGAVTADVKRLASALAEMNQLSFDDIEKQEVKQIEPVHEGVTTKVNADGTAEVVDENQTTIEQYIDPMQGVGGKQQNEEHEQDSSFNEETRSEDDENDDLF